MRYRTMMGGMTHLAARLRRLRRLPRRQREAALRAVLPYAIGDELELYAAEAIEHAGRTRDRGDLLVDVLRAWSRLSTEARAACVAVSDGRLPALLRELASSDDRSDRRASAEVAGDCIAGDIPCPLGVEPDLVLVLHDLSIDEGAVARAALDGMALAVRTLGFDHESVGALLDASVTDAVGRYHAHRHDGIMRAVADRAHKCGPRLSAWLEERSDAGHMALRSVARGRERPEQVADAVKNLGVPSLAPASVQTLESLETREERAIVLAQAHLLSCRSRCAALGRVRKVEALLGDAWDAHLPLGARRGMVRWIEALPMKPTLRVQRLTGAVSDPDAGVRLLAVQALGRMTATPQGDATLRDFCLDDHEHVAHAALSALMTNSTKRRRESLRDLLETLERSAHERVRRLALASLRTLVEDERTPDELRSALNDPDRTLVLAALQRIITRDIASEFLDELVRLSGSGDPFVVAKAVTALTRAPGERTRGVLLHALGHPDGRVVASAVEALGKRDGRAIALDAFLTSAVARVRANAVMHARRNDPDARESRDALAEMLTDARASHRISALWVTEKLGCVEMSERVAQMVREEESDEVRARSERCAERLLAKMRVGWSAKREAIA